MTPHYEPLTAKHAHTTHWTPPTNLNHIAGQTEFIVHGAEIAQVATNMPLAIKQIDGVWQLVAIAGLQPQHNLFVQNGKWLGHYQPHSISTYDFQLQLVGSKGFLLFNTAGKLAAPVGTPGAESLFKDDGSYTDTVKHIQTALLKDHARYERTQKAVQALVDAEVIMPWPHALVTQIGMQLDGLYCIDEAALAKLADNTFLRLREAQALGIAYGLNLSLQQNHLLLRLNRHNPAIDSPTDVDALFGEGGDDDTLKFNF